MQSDAREAPAPATVPASTSTAEIALSVVVPVYNQAGSIVRNVGIIRDRVAAGVAGPIEVIVVSDGSIDRTQERLLESELADVKVLHYDRNLGKGYAVKVGALEARGRWVGYVDADLDIDPAGLPDYMRIAESEDLDFALASKRHPQSQVAYPRSRRVASWLFQQFVRLLFRLDVRDTQVGLKVFRREVAQQVFPLLLVKRYAFDIEMLAVGRAFGFRRLRELPVRLDYQFTGSGVRPSAVAIALLDTLAVFYRLRILRTYQRKRALVGALGWTRPMNFAPTTTLVVGDTGAASAVEWRNLEVCVASSDADRWRIVDETPSEVVAFVDRGATPSGNFISATVPFLARGQIGAVVTSKVAPAAGSARARAAAALRESRVGGGSLYYRFMPGNIRYVREFPSASFVAKTASLRDLDHALSFAEVPAALAATGEYVVYTPEAFLVEPPPPLFRPHLREIFDYGRSRSLVRPSALVALLTALAIALVWIVSVWAWVAVLAAYAIAVVASAALAALQHRSLRVGALVAIALPPTHAAYLAGASSRAIGR